jgi:hypothetical protein
MLPEDPLDRAVVLPAHRVFAQEIDPRLYCFGQRAFDGLAPGSIVVAHLGGTSHEAPEAIAIAPLEDVQPAVASARSLDAPPVALPDDPTPVLPLSWPKPSPSPKVTLTGPAMVDAPSQHDIVIPLTLRNDGSAPLVVRFRPDTLGFDVNGKAAAHTCSWPGNSPSPSREIYETVGAHSSLEISVELSAYCASSTLEGAGLFTVRPWLDTRSVSGGTIGIRTFDDILLSTQSTLVRLQRAPVQRGKSEPSEPQEFAELPASRP